MPIQDQESFVPQWQKYTLDNQIVQPKKLQVKGNIPKWVRGSLYRNGSGIFNVGSSKANHLFDGFAVLLRFNIEDGEVTFQSKVLDTDTWEACYKAKRLVASQFGTVAVPDPCKNIFSRMFSLYTPEPQKDNTSVNIVERGDELWAFTETTPINRIDPETLARVGNTDLAKYVNVHLATAHPHLVADGTTYNLATNFEHKAAYSIIEIPPKPDTGNLDFDKSSMVASVPSRWKWNIGYNHSFGMSENYFIIMEQPLVFSIFRLIFRKLTKSPIEKCLVDYPKEKSLFHVVEKSGKRVNIMYSADSFFSFHFCNCYEEAGQLVVDVIMYKDIKLVNKLYLDQLQGKSTLKSNSTPLFGRFVLPLDIRNAEVGKNLVTLDSKATAVLQENGTVFCTPDLYSEDGIIMELPQINYNACNSKKYRYVYASTVFTKDCKVKKLDLVSRTTREYAGLENTLPGEPVFVAKPGATSEDDGVLLSPFLAMKEGDESYLAIIDAKSMEELARAVLPAEEIMTFNFHGSFKPRDI